MRYKITMITNKNAVEPIPDLDEMAAYYSDIDDEPIEEEQFDYEEYADYNNGLIAMMEERADDERR